jgi:hypothetical protein
MFIYKGINMQQATIQIETAEFSTSKHLEKILKYSCLFTRKNFQTKQIIEEKTNDYQLPKQTRSGKI